MIDDLDRTLEELLRRELRPALVEQVGISFAAPDNDFPPPSVTLPAVDLFLYDIRENLEIRNPVRVDCSYLITAWACEGSSTRALDEHRLLSEVMKALLRHPTIPEVVL